MPDQETTVRATARFPVEVGRGVAGSVERQLRQAAFTMGLDLAIEKHMGLLDGVLLCTLRGDEDGVRSYMKALDAWSKALGQGGTDAD